MAPESERKPGTVRIAPGVLVTIINSAALGVPGVIRMGLAPRVEGKAIGRIFHRNEHNGVRVEVHQEKVKVDLYLIVSKDVNMLEVGKQVQSDVSKAIRFMVGMPIEQVNVYIQNVE